jgi:hypothetical protein
VAAPVSRVLSSSQLGMLAEHGQERTADVGETLFEVGDKSYPFVAIIEGEVAVTDATGQEIVRHGASGCRRPLPRIASAMSPRPRQRTV